VIVNGDDTGAVTVRTALLLVTAPAEFVTATLKVAPLSETVAAAVV
jgi:hypothetical protein